MFSPIFFTENVNYNNCTQIKIDSTSKGPPIDYSFKKFWQNIVYDYSKSVFIIRIRSFRQDKLYELNNFF